MRTPWWARCTPRARRLKHFLLFPGQIGRPNKRSNCRTAVTRLCVKLRRFTGFAKVRGHSCCSSAGARPSGGQTPVQITKLTNSSKYVVPVFARPGVSSGDQRSPRVHCHSGTVNQGGHEQASRTSRGGGGSCQFSPPVACCSSHDATLVAAVRCTVTLAAWSVSLSGISTVPVCSSFSRAFSSNESRQRYFQNTSNASC